MMKFGGLSNAIYESARAHHEAGRLAEAEAGYRQALAMDPRHFESLHMMGMLAGQAGRHDLALQYTDQAIAVAPDLAETHVNRGMALVALERNDEAVAAFRKAVALQPGNVQAHTAIADLMAFQAKSKDAPQA